MIDCLRTLPGHAKLTFVSPPPERRGTIAQLARRLHEARHPRRHGYPPDHLQIQVESPVTQLSASLFAHDTVAVSWRAGLSLGPTDNPHVWATKWETRPWSALLARGKRYHCRATHAWLVTHGPRPMGFSETRHWRWHVGLGERAQAERERLEQMRLQHFAGPLAAPDAAQNAPQFYVLAIADNLFLTQEQSVPGITLKPMTSVLGDDIRVVLNGLLLERGFRQALVPDKWISRYAAG